MSVLLIYLHKIAGVGLKFTIVFLNRSYFKLHGGIQSWKIVNCLNMAHYSINPKESNELGIANLKGI